MVYSHLKEVAAATIISKIKNNIEFKKKFRENDGHFLHEDDEGEAYIFWGKMHAQKSSHHKIDFILVLSFQMLINDPSLVSHK